MKVPLTSSKVIVPGDDLPSPQENAAVKSAVRKSGGAVAEHIARGEAELGIHQISEILPVKGVTLVGPLPADIQNYTVYAVGLGVGAKEAEAAKAFIKVLTGPSAAGVLKSKGMDPA